MSSGHCLACRSELPEYSRRIDGLDRPWKVQCPHCEQVFPTNDFEAYYWSGLAENGEFDPERLDDGPLRVGAHDLTVEGELMLVRLDRDGRTGHVTQVNGR